MAKNKLHSPVVQAGTFESDIIMIVIQFLKHFLWEKIAVIYVEDTPWFTFYQRLQKEINQDDIFPVLDIGLSYGISKRSWYQHPRKFNKNLQAYINHLQKRAKGF